MCGIVGVIQYESETDRKIRQQALRILFSETMLKTEPRGKDATGVYQVHSDGDWLMTKKGQKVTEWLVASRSDDKNEDPIDYSDIIDSWIDHPKELSAVVGHCRAATVGSKGKDNNDNHPFAVQLDEKHAILGIHNGTLTNHERIFDQLPDLLPRHGKVDSESIFHFLYHLTEKGTKRVDEDMLKYMGERLEGAYACIMVNTRFPEQVVTFRKDRPMEYFMIAPLNVLVIASEKKFVEAAVEKYEFIRAFLPEYAHLPELEVGHRVLMDREFRIFDANLDFPKGRAIHGDFDKISEAKGDMTKHGSPIKDEWKTPSKVTTTTTSTTKSTTNTSTTKTSVKTTKATGTTGNVTAQANKSGDDEVAEVEGTIVEVPLGPDAESREGMAHVRGLGLLVHYEDTKDLAASLGVKESELGTMSGVELANLLSALHFGIGHAAARLHAKGEVATMRSKAADTTKLLERVCEKQKKAEDHIWEHRQLVTIVCALHRGRYKMSEHNVKIALSAFPKLSEGKRASILKVAKNLLEHEETEEVIQKLVARFQRAEGNSTTPKSEETS